MESNRIPLVVLVGPTAVGKTALAIELAQRLDGEIVSADSRLFYRGMDIGTAKPTPEERRRAPHHLIDIAQPDEIWSLAMFQQAAYEAIRAIHARRRLPILVGGTGQYVHAVLEGWRIPPVKPDPRLRQALEKWAQEVTPAGLHRRLQVLDPLAAEQIAYTNVRRTIRALEVILTSGKRFSQQRERQPTPFQPLILGLTLPRSDLYARIDARIEAMIQAGLVEEVRRLLAAGYSPDLPTMTAIGYREIVAVLQNKLTLEEAIQQMKRKTRQFVRRQANWFRLDDPHIQWFVAQPNPLDEIERVIRSWLDQQGF